MSNKSCVTDGLFAETLSVRRHLHAHPEIGFDLDETVAFVRGKLDAYGIPCTDRYGRNSLCAMLGDLSGRRPIVALRADMDALPIQEASGVPFTSLNPGKMHACGHDSHTAILLAVAKVLKAREAELPCGVRLIFQPSEECTESGAHMMVENGVLNGVSTVLGIHCDPALATGVLGIRDGAYKAACAPIEISFIGKSAHAAAPETGVDAIAMAVQAYGAMKQAVANEAGGRPYIWSVGTFRGGTAHNVISEHCDLDISFRYYDDAFAERVRERVEAICRQVADEAGGRAAIRWIVSAPAVINDARTVRRFRDAARARGLPLAEVRPRMSSEDFSWYLTRVPGALFRFGTRNEALGCDVPVHHAEFRIDEDGMRSGIEAFVAFVLDYAE